MRNEGVMIFRNVRQERDGHKLTLIIVNPPVNALSRNVIRELNRALKAARTEAAIKEIVITGDGNKFFSAGADINEIADFVYRKKMSRQRRTQRAFNFSRRGHKLICKIKNFPKSTTALINGVCLGGGLELALACHHRIAASHAQFGMPEITLGIIPGFGGTYTLAKVVGVQYATALIATGSSMSAHDAKTIGLVNEVIHSENAAIDLPRRPQAPRLARIIPYAIFFQQDAYEDNVDEALEEEAWHFADICLKDEAREGVRAFIEKRKPNFRLI